MTSTRQLPAEHVYVQCDLAEPLSLEIAGREVVVYTHRCPDHAAASEDAAACFSINGESGVLVVADGVGGQASGEIASGMAIDIIQDHISSARKQPAREILLDALDAANDRILNLGVGAATTLALVELQAGFVRPYHIGDSMITLMSQRGRVKWQSICHAPVGYAVEAGVLDEEEAMYHPDRHLVSNVLGQDDMRISLGPRLSMAARDTLVLCSDGLSDNVSTDETIDLLRSGPLVAGCMQLVEIAQARMRNVGHEPDAPGKPDDLTIIACRKLPESGDSDS